MKKKIISFFSQGGTLKIELQKLTESDSVASDGFEICTFYLNNNTFKTFLKPKILVHLK